MTRRARRLAVAAGLTLLAAGVAVSSGGRSAAPLPAPAPRAHVLVAARPLAAGTTLRSEDVRAVTAQGALALAAAPPSLALGRRLAVALGAGAPVMPAELAGRRAVLGLRRVALRLDPLAGVPAGGGRGEADLYVAPVGGRSTARLVARRLYVVDARTTDSGAVATVAVSAGDVAALMDAEARGSLRLVARGAGAG